MKTKSLVILAFIFSSHLYGQKNDLKKLNLNGKIKSIHEYYQTFTEKDTSKKSLQTLSYFNHFDKQGNKIEDIKYSPDGKVDKKYEYLYNKFGQRTEQNQYTSDEKLSRKITYKYDEKGNITEDNSYSSEGKLEKKFTYKYDEKGNVIEDMSFDSNNKLQKKFTHSYDNTGNKIENNRYSAQGTLDKKINYKYNIYMDVIEEIFTNIDGSKVNYYYEYKYDKKNNWTEKTSCKEKEIISIITREIKYY